MPTNAGNLRILPELDQSNKEKMRRELFRVELGAENGEIVPFFVCGRCKGDEFKTRNMIEMCDHLAVDHYKPLKRHRRKPKSEPYSILLARKGTGDTFK